MKILLGRLAAIIFLVLFRQPNGPQWNPVCIQVRTCFHQLPEGVMLEQQKHMDDNVLCITWHKEASGGHKAHFPEQCGLNGLCGGSAFLFGSDDGGATSKFGKLAIVM
jgi:hypothetical protein